MLGLSSRWQKRVWRSEKYQILKIIPDIGWLGRKRGYDYGGYYGPNVASGNRWEDCSEIQQESDIARRQVVENTDISDERASKADLKIQINIGFIYIVMSVL